MSTIIEHPSKAEVLAALRAVQRRRRASVSLGEIARELCVSGKEKHRISTRLEWLYDDGKVDKASNCGWWAY